MCYNDQVQCDSLMADLNLTSHEGKKNVLVQNSAAPEGEKGMTGTERAAHLHVRR
jgi:hypothetical protein